MSIKKSQILAKHFVKVSNEFACDKISNGGFGGNSVGGDNNIFTVTLHAD